MKPQIAATGEAMATETILSVNNIEVVFNEVILVLRGLNLNVQRGKITALLGTNGAGKSTTLKAITNLLATEDGEVTRGSIDYEGQDITDIGPEALVRKGVFLVMEGRGILQDMTVIENLRLGAYSRPNANIKEEIEEVFRFFPRLKERTGLAGYLSGGEQQMLAIGRALMAKPKLILMDEPSMGLSPLLVKEVFGIIKRLNRELGISILLVEQNANMALHVADEGYIMENGKIVLDGTAEELMDNEDVKEFYLGGGGERRSFKDIKSYKRRKRWL
ncbi:amino acid/amide ABC transporter ATP-binding protein 2 (HAAT family) [Maritalea mobilis]|uniref:Amino acid/amide ABC transporter ATP-binding protein 2 (HAAT family) n=1 Tax=Maritalea mobilis TaxID=483324 RepID=A0A4R6VK42_9HYPH|nr:ABC transporter ATP-binding protein [Maritalea mobilis]TDQ61978.1 amino acid/amide ABC transporter ATP-binding protein 2 (HAAT family) [Maritalea mobilis]